MARVAVQAAAFDAAAELAALGADPGFGGVASFIGQVRGTGGLIALTLEHYPGMTEQALLRIAAQAEAQFAPCACLVIHRVGRLEVGAPIVLVAAASPHRARALDAVRNMIDLLKTDAPFWKQEEYPDRSAWVEATAEDAASSAAWGKAGPPAPP